MTFLTSLVHAGGLGNSAHFVHTHSSTSAICGAHVISHSHVKLVFSYRLAGLVEFWEYASYYCQPSTWFESNRDKPSFEIQCQGDGSFIEPIDWPRCVESKFFLA